MPNRESLVAGGTQGRTHQHCGWKSDEVVDEFKIFMATREIADTVDLVPHAKKFSQRAPSGEPLRAA